MGDGLEAIEERVEKVRVIIKRHSGETMTIRSLRTGGYHEGIIDFNYEGDRMGFFNMFVPPKRNIKRVDYMEVGEILDP